MTFSAAPAPREITTPIILFGFHQPDRLARVCRALRAQRGVYAPLSKLRALKNC